MKIRYISQEWFDSICDDFMDAFMERRKSAKTLADKIKCASMLAAIKTLRQYIDTHADHIEIDYQPGQDWEL